MIEEDTTYVAQWIATNYTFTFNLNGGNIGGSTTNRTTSGAYNTNSTTPGTPVRSHYIFAGWSPSVPSKYDGNKSFIAQWTPVNYTFTFNLNGGNIGGSTTNKTISGLYNTNSTTPGTPVRTHYTFAGWSPSLPSKYDGNKTFTAQWTPINYTFTFNLNGGNIGGSTTNKTINGNNTQNVTTPGTPVRTHHTFAGWSPSLPSKYDGNKTFTAQWTVNNYTITYNLDGGNIGGSTNNQTRSVPYNTMPPELTPVKSGYVFIGWTPKFTVVKENATYTAIWSKPMEIQLKKTNVNDDILIPVTFSSGNFVMISNNGGEYIKYTSRNPKLNNNVAANKAFTMKIAGRVDEFLYVTEKTEQLYKVISWGELGVRRYGLGSCKNLIGPLPGAEKNTFINVTGASGMFSSCTSLTGPLPADLFANAFKITSFYSTFINCPALTGPLPANLFADCPKVTTFESVFRKCSSLNGSIPADLFKNNSLVKYMESAFADCTGLTGSIPSGLFRNCTEIERFGSVNMYTEADKPNIVTYTRIEGIFSGCSGLTGSIPSDLFKNNTKVTNFSEVFYRCENLTGSIPKDLFKYNTEAHNFTRAFEGCKKLTGQIPVELFQNNKKVTRFSSAFEDCVGLTGMLPSDLFAQNNKVQKFNSVFRNCSGLTGSIPSGFFSNFEDLNEVTRAFKNCRGLSGPIPSNLFENSSNIINFNEVFDGCNKLSGSIPVNLFSTNIKAEGFSVVFAGCSSLTGSVSINLFANNINAKYFFRTFAGASNLSGNAPALWTKPNIASHHWCFQMCNFNNQSQIPSDWK